MNMFSRKQMLLLAVIALASISCQGQKVPGVSENQILIGSCSALDGPAQFLGRQTIVGATTYLKTML